MSDVIRLNVDYPHPPQKVWQAISSREALTAWLMPNDFEPVVGHRFQFRTAPAPGFDGVINSEVLAVDPPRRLSFTWVGGPLESVVTITLEPTASGGTRFSLEHTGFDTLKKRMIGMMLNRGWKHMTRDTLPAVLSRLDSEGRLRAAGPLPDEAPCRKGPLTRVLVSLIGLVPGQRKA